MFLCEISATKVTFERLFLDYNFFWSPGKLVPREIWATRNLGPKNELVECVLSCPPFAKITLCHMTPRGLSTLLIKVVVEYPSSTVKFLKSAIKGKQKFSEASKGRQNKRTLLSHDLRLLLWANIGMLNCFVDCNQTR